MRSPGKTHQVRAGRTSNLFYYISRYFTTKKTAYTFYGDGTDANQDEAETHEMKSVRNGSSGPKSVGAGEEFDVDFSATGTNGTATAAQQLPQQPPANNPFRRETANNPFHQSNV